MNRLIPAMQWQRGFTLVELMVAMTIGLILLAGVAQVFASNKQAYRYNESLSELQDNGNFAIQFIANQLANAGRIPDPWLAVRPGVDTKIWSAIETQVYPAANLPVTGTEGGMGNDSLILNIAYPVTIATPPTDCAGTAVPNPGNFNLSAPNGFNTFGITNTFTIAIGAAGRPALFCNGVEIVEGVENLQVMYGVDTDGDRLVDRYFDISQVPAVNVRDIYTVRVALMVATVKEARSAKTGTTTKDLIGTSVTLPNDKRLRQVYTATVRLHNRCANVFENNRAAFGGADACM